jgi:Pyruvate ferredoxin/flavodoxin oxidoreductase/Pyruvate ferredoxin oxidoreductase beta subunit C terminal
MGADVNVRVTGGAGQGVHTAGGLLSRLVAAAGHHFHATQDYMSRIRGGRNSYSAFELSLGWEERIPIGVLYRLEDRSAFEELHPGVGDPPLHARGTPAEGVRDLLRKRLFTL